MLRRMRLTDLEAVAAIELEALSPWGRRALEQELRQPKSLQFVAEDNDLGVISGWCCGRLIGPEAELLKISVLRSRRRSGIASLLLARLVQEVVAAGGQSLYLEVRAENAPAVLFYRKHGFKRTGLRKKYYTDPEDDAVVFVKDLLFNGLNNAFRQGGNHEINS